MTDEELYELFQLYEIYVGHARRGSSLADEQDKLYHTLLDQFNLNKEENQPRYNAIADAGRLTTREEVLHMSHEQRMTYAYLFGED